MTRGVGARRTRGLEGVTRGLDNYGTRGTGE